MIHNRSLKNVTQKCADVIKRKEKQKIQESAIFNVGFSKLITIFMANSMSQNRYRKQFEPRFCYPRYGHSSTY